VIEFREATPSEIETWDALTVLPAGGHVLQSRPWAQHRARMGWQPRFLIGSDGSAVLALLRPWRLVGGASAYIPRGPIPNGAVDELVARLAGVTDWLVANHVDVVATDAEVATWTGYGDQIAALGYRSIEEIQPSRHRLVLQLGDRIDEETALGNIGKSTRQRIHQAERRGIKIVRYDASVEGDEVGLDFLPREDPPVVALTRFHGFLQATGRRRRFALTARSSFMDWSHVAYRAGYLVLLEARDLDGVPFAGVVLYRHGGRFSIAFSGDEAGTQERHPGVFHLLGWRAIQLAIQEGSAELDLGGVDVAGARHEPQAGEPMYGLYQYKRSFGAEWLELVGAHERVISPARYLVGRIAARTLGRSRPAAAEVAMSEGGVSDDGARRGSEA
jgi:lipid II:glycine glycyltransferase (peptidoglycan interpeptide bridge formation enzyme)